MNLLECCQAQYAVDAAHFGNTVRCHINRRRALYLIVLLSFWPIPILVLLSPLYAALYAAPAWYGLFWLSVAGGSLIWLNNCQQNNALLIATQCLQDRHRTIRVYGYGLASIPLVYLPVAIWAVEPITTVLTLMAMAVGLWVFCTVIVLKWRCQSTLKLTRRAPWYLTHHLLIYAVALPTLLYASPLVALLSAGVAVAMVSGWLRGQQFLLGATSMPPLYLYVLLNSVILALLTAGGQQHTPILVGWMAGLVALNWRYPLILFSANAFTATVSLVDAFAAL